MSAEIELKIQKLFIEHKAAKSVAEALVKESVQGDFDETDIEVIAAFCQRSGSYKALLNLCIERLATKSSIPWESLARTLHYDGLLFDRDITGALFEGAQKQLSLESLAASEVLDASYPQFVELREKTKARYYAEHGLKKSQILDQIEIARTQQLLEEERRLIDRLARLFPNEELGADQKQLFQERWARDILSKRSGRPPAPKWEPDGHILTPEQKSVTKVLLAQALKLQAETPSLGQDLPTLFLMFDDYESALELLRAQPSSLGRDWLEVEVLLWMRHFIQALNLAQELEPRYAKEPDTAFAAAYLKAQALWGLQKRDNAIEIMESVVSARPTYRSAHSYLSLWKGSER